MNKVSDYNYAKAADYVQAAEKSLHENVGFYVDGQWKEIKTADIKLGAPYILQFKDKINAHITSAKIDNKYAIAVPESPKQGADKTAMSAYKKAKDEFLKIAKAAKEEFTPEKLESKKLITQLQTVSGEFEEEGKSVTYIAYKLVNENDVIFSRFPVILHMLSHYCHNSIIKFKKAEQQQNDAKDLAALLNLNINNTGAPIHNTEMDQDLENLFGDL